MANIPKEEQDVLFELENLIGKSIPQINQIWEFNGDDEDDYDEFGYVIHNNHVAELSIKFLLECDPNRNFEKQIEYLPESIGKLTMLEKIDLSFNSLSSLPESFFSLTNLREIYMGANSFYEIPDKFDKFPQLEKLHLADYRVTISHISSNDLDDMIFINSSWILLPNSILKLENLKTLDLNGILTATYNKDLYKILIENGCNIVMPRETVILDKNMDDKKFERIRFLMAKGGFYLSEAEVIYKLETIAGEFEFERYEFQLFNEADLVLIEYGPGYISRIIIPELEENRDINETAKFIAKKCKNFGKDEFLVETPLRYYDHSEDY